MLGRNLTVSNKLDNKLDLYEKNNNNLVLRYLNYSLVIDAVILIQQTVLVLFIHIVS